MRDQSRLSVKPRLVFNTWVQTNDSIVTFNFAVQNKGLGPAIIKEATIIHESAIFPLNFDFFMDYNFPKLGEYGNQLTTTSLNGEDIISVGEVYELIVFQANVKDLAAINDYLKLNDSDYLLPWDVKIIYESLYEEEWNLNYQKNQNRIVKE